MKKTYDFGEGPVPAHQHPNGGGWVADTAFVADSAEVSGNARVYGKAKVYGNARVYDEAEVYGNTWVYGSAQVSGNAQVYNDAQVYGNTWVYGSAQVSGNARVFGNAWVYENAWVYGNARVFGNAQVYNDAQVYGNARVYGNAEIYGNAWIKVGSIVSDIKKDLFTDILAQTGLVCKEDHVIAYKRVNADLSSEYDSKFKYEVGEWAVAENPEESEESCARGLHVSYANYYPKAVGETDKVILECRVMLEDIITVQSGKIRCRKLFVERVAF